jgi:hypothetical protein
MAAGERSICGRRKQAGNAHPVRLPPESSEVSAQ